METSSGNPLGAGRDRPVIEPVDCLGQHQQLQETLRASEARYLAFISQGTEGISRWEAERPLPISLPEDEQIDWMFRHAYLAECNPAYARMYGRANPADMLGLRLGDVCDVSDPRTVAAARTFVREGYRAVELETHEVDAQDRVHCFSSSLAGVVENGFLVRAWSVQRDVTERARAMRQLEDNLRLQHAISSILRLGLEEMPLPSLLEQTLDAMLSVPGLGLASRGCISVDVGWRENLAEDLEQPPGTVLKAHRGLPAEVVAHCGQSPFGRCVFSGATPPPGALVAEPDHPPQGSCQNYLPPHRHCCVPIVLDQHVYGRINLFVEAGHTSNATEQEFFSSVANALAGVLHRRRIEAAQRQRHAELLTAQGIQKQLQPQAPPAVAGFEIAGATYPAEQMAGDYFDYLCLPDHAVGIVLGDVSGHGLGPSLLAVSAQTLLRVLADVHSDMGALLARANVFLERQTEVDRFVTLFFGRLDPASRVFSYVSAGHETGFVLDAAGAVRLALTSTAVPLGILPDTHFYEGERIALAPGDTVVLLTDGVTEARSQHGECFGSRRALDIVRACRGLTAGQIVERLYQAVRDFAEEERLTDDATLVVLKVEP